MNKSSKIARGGLLTALSVLLIYLTNIAPTSKLSILTIVSAIIPFSILTIGIKYSAIVYSAVSILSLILPSKGIGISYILFFGLYGFVKYYVESLNKTIIEIIVKLIYFNISLLIIYNLYSLLFFNALIKDFPVYVLAIGAQFAFIIYDYVLTSMIIYMRNKFIK